VLSILFVTLMSIYLSTICPTVYSGDSGELTAAAYCLGIPHPTGYPLYVLAGKIFCMIPLGSIAFRMNFMSAVLVAMAVTLTCSLIRDMASSGTGALVGALILGLTPSVWGQATSAEVYALHLFFIALLAKLLWRWDKEKNPRHMALIAFVSGLSFGNHMQTVMLAPPVLFLILSRDWGFFCNGKRLLTYGTLFVTPLFIYLYLPIRAVSDAGIRWGDPDNLRYFLDHVTGASHRSSYVFNLGIWEYWTRTQEAVELLLSQFGILLLLAAWGWVSLRSTQWRAFIALTILFDFFYTVFLNTISLKVTPFNLATSVVVSLLIGVGISHGLKALERFVRIGKPIRLMVRTACWAMPVIFLFSNFALCDQGRNYIAYEHSINVLRTVKPCDILLVDGDNYLFPVFYARLVERGGEEIVLYDRQNIVFKMPYVGDHASRASGRWETVRTLLEWEMVRKPRSQDIYYAVFDPLSIPLPEGYAVEPLGLVYRVMRKEGLPASRALKDVSEYYATESYFENMVRDYLSRQMTAHFLFRYGQSQFASGSRSAGLQQIREASRMMYDDQGLNVLIAMFFIDKGIYSEAREELKKIDLLPGKPEIKQSLWGYYYCAIGNYANAVEAYKKAIQLNPESPVHYRNLALALHRSGKTKEALDAYERSHRLSEKQGEMGSLSHGTGSD